MVSILTASAFLLAWFSFRYERHRRWRGDVDAAYGTLRAVHHGMVSGLTPGQPVGWGQIYFSTIYTEAVAKNRAQTTFDLVMKRGFDMVLVVPTEPLAMLATTTPRDGLIEQTTVTIANFALWRVHAFNQLVSNLADFYVVHGDEIASNETNHDRRVDLAEAAMSLSFFVHRDGVGEAWATDPKGDGWYRALVTQVIKNIGDLMELRTSSRWRWLREWPYVLIDVLAVAGVVVVIAVAAAGGDEASDDRNPATTITITTTSP